jgi:hypothetical protein
MLLRSVLVALLVALCVDARLAINCDKDNTYLYKYRAEAAAFGGNSKQRRQHEQSTEITADVALQCHQSYKIQGNKKTNVVSLNFENVRLHERKPSTRNGWKNTRSTTNSSPVNFGQFFSKPTFATVEDDGRVLQVFSDHNELVWVRHMKKGVVDLLNTKVRGGPVRVDESMMGKHTSRYTRTVDKMDTHCVTRKWDQDDFSTPLFNPRESTVQSEASVHVKNGTIIMATTSRKAIIGVNPRKHRIFKNQRETIGFSPDTHANMKHVSGPQGTFTDTKATAKLVLTKIVPSNTTRHAKLHEYFHGVVEEQSDQIVPLRLAHRRVYSTSPVLKSRKHVHASTISFEESMGDHMDAMRAQKLKQEVNIVDDLVHLFKDPDNGTIRSRLSEYVRSHPVGSLAALKKTVEIAQQHGKKDVIKVIQSLMVAIGTHEAQDALLETLTDDELTQHFLITSINIKKPSDKLIHHIRELQKGLASLSDSESENENLKNLAYLVTADAISRSENTALRQQIVDEMVNNLHNEEHPQDMLLHFHALGNAKTATPVVYWRRFLSTKHIPSHVHNLILNNLEHRTEHGADDNEVTRLLHDVISSKHFHPDVKATAVSVQDKRHRRMGKSTSMYYLAGLYKESDDSVKRAIEEYLSGVGNKRAAYVMSTLTDNVEIADELRDQMRKVIMADAQFLGWIGDAFRRIGDGVGRAVRGVVDGAGRVIRTVATGVGNAVKFVGKTIASAANWVGNAFKSLKTAFAPATFKNGKSCVPASSKPNDEICTYDEELTSFVQGQGDLSNIKSNKHFEFEKLIGAEAVHLYVGMVGYAGYRLSCGNAVEPAAFEFSTFAMAKSYAKIFSKNVKLVSAQVSFGKLVNSPARNDATVKLGGVTLFDRNILPNSVSNFLNYCESKTTPLINKSYPELVNFKYAFVLVSFPVEMGFSVEAHLGVDAVMSLCVSRLEASVSIEPWFTVSVAGYGSLSILAAKGGVQLRSQMNYRLIPRLAIEKCQVCAELRNRVKPISFFVGVFFQIWDHKWDKDLFNFESPETESSLFKLCIGPKPK